ncbi:Ferredoxin, 2Fe-2S [Petrocella atlantisensis]|uniref:Ferredoxin, 2Fe-2S n=1 Tax=Petrocella atlantisensis TaxID=2173034 RepID=A0A3P7P430_9FIRM|nr:(2Fe-2S) ferredoxin domain-containing protein [Petrocella atlantisensis]VDN48320.1 Ferredoxin, 2Fe-2S [Petrocella atlantisensis]
MNLPKKHIFVCSSARLTGEIKGFCAQNEGLEILENFVEEVQERELDGDMMVTNTGCLGMCSMGPIVIVYPEGTWYGRVTADDVEEIMDALESGEVVKRLLIE